MAVPSAVAGLLGRPARIGDEVYSAIFSRIMSLDIASGARISIDAMARLESEGLVNKTHLVGYSAAPQLSDKQFADLYELRLLLEPFAARKCAEIMPDDVIAQLEGLCADMALLAQQEGLEAYAEFAQLDMAFHDQIAVSAGNSLVVDALNRLHTHVHLFRLVYQSRAVRSAIEEHRGVLAAIRLRNGAAAEAAMREHIQQSRERFKTRQG